MPLPRLLTLLVGIALILGLVIWLVDALVRLSWNLSYMSPVLGSIVVVLLIVLLGLLVGTFIYYLWFLPHRSKRRSQQKRPIPTTKQEATVANLQGVRQQVSHIQDEVVRQELISRSKEIEQQLARGELKIAVFGTGSAGKTSLVNALMGRMVGQVGATMGTTDVGATYRLQLKGVDRQILITDTPGILEAGDAGSQRETRARRLATEADLLLFVLDNDLRQSEFDPLRDLIAMGKRSLVVLNKVDLLPESDVQLILARLRQRLRTYVAADDVIAVSAHPVAVPLDTGEWVTPEPEVMPLIEHIAAVVRAEGDDLLADNILLQSQRLGEEARQVIAAQRRRQANKIVDRFQWIGAGVIAATPLPVVDLLATAAVNAQMVVELGRVYGCDINLDRGRELALSLAKTLVSLGVVKGAVTIVTTALQASIAGLIVGQAIQGVSAAYLTRIAGKSFIEYFQRDQDWGDGGISEVVQRQFQLNRKEDFIKAFIQDAVAKVVRPLQLDAELAPEDQGDRASQSEGALSWEEPVASISPTPIEEDWAKRSGATDLSDLSDPSDHEAIDDWQR
jgi:small GTP-binding protein